MWQTKDAPARTGAGETAPALPDVAPSMISIRGLQKIFATRSGENVQALSNIDLEIADHEFISVVGPSGCGKTTLLRILAGLDIASAGVASVDGEPLSGPRADVGVVFQQATLLPWNDVLNNVLLPLQLRGDRSQASVDRAKKLLSFMGLGDFAKKYPFELSGGMQQRVAICRALMRDPRILLMDEPFGALDAMTREMLNMELMRVWSDERKTVVFITHSIPEAVLLGDRVVVMSPRPGRISAIIPVDIERPRSLRTMGLPRFGAICDEIRSMFGAEHNSIAAL